MPSSFLISTFTGRDSNPSERGPRKVGDFVGKRSRSDANVAFQEKKIGSILKVGVHVACGDAVPEGAPRRVVHLDARTKIGYF